MAWGQNILNSSVSREELLASMRAKYGLGPSGPSSFDTSYGGTISGGNAGDQVPIPPTMQQPTGATQDSNGQIGGAGAAKPPMLGNGAEQAGGPPLMPGQQQEPPPALPISPGAPMPSAPAFPKGLDPMNAWANPGLPTQAAPGDQGSAAFNGRLTGALNDANRATMPWTLRAGLQNMNPGYTPDEMDQIWAGQVGPALQYKMSQLGPLKMPQTSADPGTDTYMGRREGQMGENYALYGMNALAPGMSPASPGMPGSIEEGMREHGIHGAMGLSMLKNAEQKPMMDEQLSLWKSQLPVVNQQVAMHLIAPEVGTTLSNQLMLRDAYLNDIRNGAQPDPKTGMTPTVANYVSQDPNPGAKGSATSTWNQFQPVITQREHFETYTANGGMSVEQRLRLAGQGQAPSLPGQSAAGMYGAPSYGMAGGGMPVDQGATGAQQSTDQQAPAENPADNQAPGGATGPGGKPAIGSPNAKKGAPAESVPTLQGTYPDLARVLLSRSNLSADLKTWLQSLAAKGRSSDYILATDTAQKYGVLAAYQAAKSASKGQ